MRSFRVAVLLSLMASIPLAAGADPEAAKEKEKGKGPKRARFGDVATYGPVALGATHGLRLCHANHFGSQPISVEWVFVAIAPPDPAGAPPAGVPTEVVGQLQFDLPPGTGNCADFAPDLGTQPEGASIIAILIGLLRNGHTTENVVGSAQVTDLMAGGAPNPSGELLPAVQKQHIRLPAVQ